MAPVAGVVAHGGVGGAIVEGLVFLTVVAVLVAVWLREWRAGHEQGSARFRNDE